MTADFNHLSHAGILSLIPYKPGKSIEELAHEKGLSDIIKLASNENPLGCSPLALKALQNMNPHTLAMYPSPANHPLLSKLAQLLKISTKELFLSNGSDYIFTVLLNCFALHTGKHILIHDYAFSTYAIQAHSFNIPVRSVAIEADWQVNIDKLIEACNEHTGLLFLANPNNPTGLLISQENIEHLLNNIPENTIVVLDEAYHEFVSDQQKCSSLELLAKHPNLVLTRTFSKIYGLAGLRIGYAVANAAIIALLHRVQLPFAVNSAALTAAFAALDDHEFLELSLKNNHEGMEQMSRGLSELGLDYLPSACNFISFNCKQDSSILYNFLLDKGIIVRPLHPYKMDHFIRVTIGTKEQNQRFLTALSSFYHQ